MSEVFLRAPQVGAQTGHSPKQVKRKARDPNDPFPAGIRLSPRVTVWLKSEVDAWMADQIRLHRAASNGHADAPAAAPGDDEEPEAAETRPYGRTGTGRHSRGRRKGRAA